MRDQRLSRVLRPSLALVALAALIVVVGLAIAGPAHAATASPKPKASKTAKAERSTKAVAKASATASPSGAAVQRGAEVRAGEDVVVLKGTSVPSVVAFGGDIKVDGAVEDAVVAFGGDVIVNGTVGQSVVAFGGDIVINGTVNMATVAFGGDVKLTRNASVGSGLKASDASVVVAGGKLTRVEGAQIHGRVEHSAGNVNWGGVVGWGTRGLLFNPLLGLSFVGWLLQTVFFLVLALVVAALMPGQLRRTQGRVRRSPWASLGWGALAFFIAVPALFVVVGITIIGLLLWLPMGLFVLFIYFFGATAVAAFLAQKVLTAFGRKENLMLAVAIGVVGTTIVSRIPALGPLALLAMNVIGTGAAILAFVEWRRERRAQEAAKAAALAAIAPAQYAVSTEASTASVITPIVQTSPAQQAPPQPAPQPVVPPPASAGPPPPQPPVAPEAPQGQAGMAPPDGGAQTPAAEGGQPGQTI